MVDLEITSSSRIFPSLPPVLLDALAQIHMRRADEGRRNGG